MPAPFRALTTVSIFLGILLAAPILASAFSVFDSEHDDGQVRGGRHLAGALIPMDQLIFGFLRLLPR